MARPRRSKTAAAAALAKNLNVPQARVEDLLLPASSGTPDFARPQPALRDKIISLVYDGLTGNLDRKSPDDEALDGLREKCRQGNPFPLIAYQWPALIVTDEEEAAMFKDFPVERMDLISPQIRAAILNPENPALRLDWWQQIILAGFFDPTIGEIFIKGCTGAGKGAATGIGFSLWYDVFHESRITLTGRDHSHAILNIFGEVKQWMMRMRSPAAARILGQGISDNERHYIRVLNPDPSSPTAGEAFSGAHGKNTIYGFDESSALPLEFFENAEKNARKIISLSNPRTLFGHFRNAFKPLGPAVDGIATTMGTLGVRLCVTVGGSDCMNVRKRRVKIPVAPIGGIDVPQANGDVKPYPAGERIDDADYAKLKPLIQNQIDLAQFRAICAKPDQRHVDVFAHGKFPMEDPTKQVILQSWLEFHEKAWNLASPPIVEAFGLDVARSLNGDETVLTAGGKDGCRAIHKWQYNNISYHAAEVLRIAKEFYGIDLKLGRVPVAVDMDGLGAGAGDILRGEGVWVIEFRGNASSTVDARVYGNLRAEAYATLGRRLNPDDRWKGVAWALPADENLRQELCAPEKVYSSDALRFHITPKNSPPGKEGASLSVRDKLGRSPDTGDAVVYLWHAVMILHNFAAWLQDSQRELLVWPLPEKKREDERRPQTPEEIAAAAEKERAELEAEPEILKLLRANYGGLMGKDAPDPEKVNKLSKEPDWAFLAGHQSGQGNGHPAGQNGSIGEHNPNGNGQLPPAGSGHLNGQSSGKAEPAKEPGWQDRVKWDD